MVTDRLLLPVVVAVQSDEHDAVADAGMHGVEEELVVMTDMAAPLDELAITVGKEMLSALLPTTAPFDFCLFFVPFDWLAD